MITSGFREPEGLCKYRSQLSVRRRVSNVRLICARKLRMAGHAYRRSSKVSRCGAAWRGVARRFSFHCSHSNLREIGREAEVSRCQTSASINATLLDVRRTTTQTIEMLRLLERARTRTEDNAEETTTVWTPRTLTCRLVVDAAAIHSAMSTERQRPTTRRR